MMLRKLICLILGLAGLSGYLHAQPVADFSYTYTNSGCSPDSVVFSNTSSGAISYRWRFGEGTPPVYQQHTNYTYSTPGTYVVELVAYGIGGDSSITTQTLQIKAVPFVSFFATPNPVCQGQPVTFTNNSTDVSDLTWDFGDTNTSDAFEPVHTYSDTGNFTVTLESVNQCGVMMNSINVNVGDDVLPDPSFTISADTVCPGYPLLFQNGSEHGYNTFLWDFGDGNTSPNTHPAYTYDSTGTFDAILYVTNGCGTDSMIQQVVVDNNTMPDITLNTSVDTVCPEDPVSFNASGAGVTHWNWDFDNGDSSLQQNIEYRYDLPGEYNVRLSGTNACGNAAFDTTTVVVSNAANPFSDFLSYPSMVCPGDEVVFSNSSQGYTEWVWKFGDNTNTSSDRNPQHVYSDTGVYEVQLITFNGCGNTDTMTQPISVSDGLPASASFTVDPSTQRGCQGTIFQFYSGSFGGSAHWDFGNGDTSVLPNPTHTYDSDGAFMVTLTKTNGCGHKAYDASTINVGHAPPRAEFLGPPGNICPGESAGFNVSTTTADSIHWDFGDGNTSNDPTVMHTYQSSGVYMITLKVFNACGADSTTRQINVRPGPVSDFEYTPTCEGSPTYFTDLSQGNPVQWAWDLGDGKTSTQQSPVHTYNSAGLYSAHLTTYTNGCSSTKSQSVIIAFPADPVAGFYTTINQFSVSFTDTSTNADTWFWDFGDGNTSTVRHPVHFYEQANIYDVTLSTSNACGFGDTITKTIVVSSASQLQDRPAFHVYPNPASDKLYVDFNLPKSGDVTVQIYATSGRMIQTEQLIRQSGTQTVTLDIQPLSPAVYFLRVGTTQTQYRSRFIKAK